MNGIKSRRPKGAKHPDCLHVRIFMYCSQVSKQAYSKMKKSDMFQKHRFSAEIMALKKTTHPKNNKKIFFFSPASRKQKTKCLLTAMFPCIINGLARPHVDKTFATHERQCWLSVI